MGGKLQDSAAFQLGDKVRIRSGPLVGARGIILSQVNEQLEIQVKENDIICVPVNSVTNYSLAARCAWKSMPKKTGRPQLAVPRKKMVSMRLDVDAWDRLGEAVDLGLIPSREEAVNTWIWEHVDMLFSKNTNLAEEQE